MVNMCEREYDFIIFGGHGFMGKHVLRNLVRWLEMEKKPRWIAIAGDNKTQLQIAVTEVAIQMDRNLNDVGLIVTHSEDETSLQAMCSRTKLILNACDMENLDLVQRERLAKACIEKRTHLLDIADEPEYLDLIQLKYHEAAKAAGIYLIPSVDVNCVPIDIGVDYLKQQFLPSGRLESVEGYISFQSAPHHHHPNEPNQSSHHYFNSFLVNSIVQPSRSKKPVHPFPAIYAKDQNNNTNKQVKSSFTHPSRWAAPSMVSIGPAYKPKLKATLKPFRSLFKRLPRRNSELGSSWIVPITSANIVWKSQTWFYEAYREPATRFDQYLVVPEGHQIILLVLGLVYLTLLTWFLFSRKLLTSYPTILTFGYVKSTKETNERPMASINTEAGKALTSSSSSSFSIHLVGHGWDSPSDSSDGRYLFPPNKTIRVSIEGHESGYETTSLILIQSGLTLLEETSSMPYKGGCLTPAFAFRYTSLRDRLHSHGLQFKILPH